MITIIATIISSILYRIGGAGKEEIKFANSQYRDIGCPVIVLIVLLISGYTWYLCLASALLVLGFIRTYFDFLTGGKKDNLWLHGMFLGLSMLPLAWSGVPLLKIVEYTSILTFSVGGLNTFCTRVRVPFSVWVEELFRGFIIIYALSLTGIIN